MPNEQENTSSFSITLSLDIGQVTLDAGMVETFYFIEDIFSYSVTGKIRFKDNDGIFEFGPVTGNEQINILYGQEYDMEWSFNIYKMKKVEQDSTAETATSQTIEIFFTDKMFFPLNFLKFSMSWMDERTINIINQISENMLGVTQWDKKEDIEEIMDLFYMPYWTPNKTISWLLKRSTSVVSGISDMCFYNNSLGSNLVSLESLLSESNLMTIGNGDDGIYVFADPNLFLFNKILDWNINSVDTTALQTLNGSTNFGYDTETKSFVINKTTYAEMVDRHTILGTKTLFPDYSDDRTNFNMVMENTDDNINKINTNKWNKMYDKQQTLSIVVRGHENRYCGGMIEIEWPSKDKITSIYNKNLSGKYLIKSVIHNFSGYSTPGYLQKLVLIKNGYNESDATSLLDASKTNV